MTSKLITAVTKMMAKKMRLRFGSGSPRCCSMVRNVQSVKKYRATATSVKSSTCIVGSQTRREGSVSIGLTVVARLREST